MPFPQPTETQARVLWFSATTLAVAVSLGILALLLWGLGQLLNALSSVVLPLAVAGILAYLLDPMVDFIEKRNIPRVRAILLVFFLALMLVLILLATVVPQLVVETNQLVSKIPEHAEKLRTYFSERLADSPWGAKAKGIWDAQLGPVVQDWVTSALPTTSAWLLTQVARAASWFGLIVGFALVPVFTFYFLLEKQGIQGKWTDYLPVRESKLKEEMIFVLNAINDSLIVFFRGQVLVALCSGSMLTIGFFLMGLPYALLLGVMAGLLGVVPYLGVAISIVPSVAIAAVHFGDWLHPVLVLVIFAVVQAIEGLFTSPKIIGDRVGLHPLAIIISVLVGTTLMGGILGGVLAIPLTAALRALMFRYVWRKDGAATG